MEDIPAYFVLPPALDQKEKVIFIIEVTALKHFPKR
jgi:hypothetical protein